MTTFLSDEDTRPRRRLRKLWFFGVPACVLLALLSLLAMRIFSNWSFDEPLPSRLDAIRNLPVTLPDGKAAVLGDVVQPGLPTVISIWASWCEPCMREAPKIAELRREFPPAKLNLVYLNVRDSYSSKADLEAFISEYSLPRDGYVIAGDEERLSSLTHDARNAVPHTLVFDRKGKPVASILGYKPLALARVAGLVAN